MKILIVSHYFPQYNSIASLRPYSWAKWWSKAGHEVTVLTTVKNSYPNDLNLDCSGFTVIALPIPFISKASLAYRRSAKTSALSLQKTKWYLPILEAFKKWYSTFAQNTGCFHACRYPDFFDLWAKRAIKEIKSSHFDLVISSGGPYSVHRIGLFLKKKHPNIKWVIDWRDLWTKNHLYKGFFLFRFYESYLENFFHKNADLITTVSEPLANTLRGMTKTDVRTIYNGFDPDDFQKLLSNVRPANKIFTIVYTGTIYKGYQDPAPLFEAISNLKQQKLLCEDQLKICFAGPSDVYDIAKKYNVAEFYSFLGLLPRENALKLQYDADAVLFLEYSNPSIPGILTGKLFEYLYIAQEILAVGIDLETTAGALIRDAKAGTVLGTDVGKIEEYLRERVLHKNKFMLQKNEEIIREYNRQEQAMKILEYVGS